MKNKRVRFINFYTILCCVFTVFIVVGGVSFSILYPEDSKPVKIVKSVKKKSVKEPVELKHFEIYPSEEMDLYIPLDDDDVKIDKGLPKVAIIIDDIGFDKSIAFKLMDLGVPVTLSILPFSPYGDSISFNAKEKNVELMLHLPMEPFEYPRVKPGPGAILTSMKRDEVLMQLEKDIYDVPYIKGVNNHMGSKLTSSREYMEIVLGFISERNLYYIDSRTSKDTVCSKVAKEFKISFGERDIFLDHLQDEENISKQMDKLFKVAEKKGWAIGIGHPHINTLNVLIRRLTPVKNKYRFVYASELVLKK